MVKKEYSRAWETNLSGKVHWFYFWLKSAPAVGDMIELYRYTQYGFESRVFYVSEITRQALEYGSGGLDLHKDLGKLILVTPQEFTESYELSQKFTGKVHRVEG